ncbi:cobyric acid synthase [Thermosulfurimonas sp. F29]|uniref:cobyric acid synthase n=1 Tax=Thermosulfurimonas sp. F29 TaxID=2867247 RepID=UPI001C82DCC4|nr:cobyric acid synthase [Thermosulfurimonas sp. F29]MBX6422107.1 cobyric acid synthase [Thermosulfurimonas sp. F29]
MGRALAFVGTMSSVGKSLLAALACRYFSRRGLRVVPFKAQNMSLNALATEEGEMAWAQAYQALAAGRRPSVRMNPLLLKPLAERRAEIIFLGKPEGILPAGEFRAFRRRYRERVFAVFEELLHENDLVIIEGAGGLAELNLLEGDIANYELLRTYGIPYVLVGEIDRGGIFAQIWGTYELVPELKAQSLGFVVNKFRGDPALFEEGLRLLEERTGRPALGLLPYLSDHFLEEDSASLRLSDQSFRTEGLRVAVLAYPYLANFLDLDPLRYEEGVELLFTRNPRVVAEAHLVILPGSRNVGQSLAWIRENGLDEVLGRIAERGVILGLCGGFQILGRRLIDPEGLEFGGELPGLGLLPHETIFRSPKRSGPLTDHPPFPFWKEALSGFEIRYGRSYLGGNEVVSVFKERIMGTYLHGIFFEDRFREAFLNYVRRKAGLPEKPSRPYRERVGAVLDRALGLPAFAGLFKRLAELV